MSEQLLDKINFPEDLRRLSKNQLKGVCDELREFIIDAVSCNPGHFGASLGTVELSVALHYVLNTPYDRIVWDVGHQAVITSYSIHYTKLYDLPNAAFVNRIEQHAGVWRRFGHGAGLGARSYGQSQYP